MTVVRDPYQPRPIDRAADVPLDDSELGVLDDAKILAAPGDPADWPRWREQLHRWRDEARERVAYDGARYDDAPTDCYVVGFTWLWDESLYDHDRGVFTVDAFVAYANAEFGGYDGVVLWHAYPNEGIDDRTQLAYYDVPELPDVVARLQALGVRVFLAYYPWEPGDRSELAKLVASTGADGVFLDSVKQGDDEIRAVLDDVRAGVTLEAESVLPLTRVHDHAMSWAQWCADSPVPGVLRAKWFERRHMLHHTRRWHRSHLDEIHSAFLNGCGVLVWESVFGVWVGWSERDKAMLRAIRPVVDAYTPWLQSEHWTPLADHAGGEVYASRWEHESSVLWTIVNRGEDMVGPWLCTDVAATHTWTELTSGRPLSVETDGSGRTIVGGSLPAGAVAAVYAHPTRAPEVVGAQTPPNDDSFPARVAERVPFDREPHLSTPLGMAGVAGGRHELVVRHRFRETGLYGETPYVDEWKPLPPRLHHTATVRRVAYLRPFAIAQREVTRREYARFVAATGYTPVRPERFLADWIDGAPAPVTEDDPVTYVEHADARAYARWMGMRLPTEDEWQVAAEAGLVERAEPRVWNLTESEHTDGRTRFSILKGGCDYTMEGSDWYFDGGVRGPEFSAKFLHVGAGIGRSPSIGFRCAIDLEGR
ncbi:MAG: formylglycine-generating enzyme family protein [Actinomycetia bacterium]|nr:formylglycine-generating enzyme family protein [Actinomycetes bacterium]